MKAHRGPALLSGHGGGEVGGDYRCVKAPDVSGNNVMIVHVRRGHFCMCARACRAGTRAVSLCARVLDAESAGTRGDN